MSSVNGTNGNKPPAKLKNSSELKEFLIAGKKLFLEKDPNDYDQLLDQKHDLERKLGLKSQDLDAKVKELAALKATSGTEIAKLKADHREEISILESKNNTIREQFEEWVVIWNDGTTKQRDLEKKITRQQKDLVKANDTEKSSQAKISELEDALSEHQAALDEARQDLETTKQELNSKERDLNSKDRELKGAVAELETIQTDLKRYQSELGLENPAVDKITNIFHALADECHRIARTFFHTQLPQELISNSFWKVLESSGFIKVAPKRTPLTNSDAAQCLRMATAERIMADKLCTNIFRSYYLPETNADRGVIDNILRELGKSNPYREAVFRLQLLAAYEPYEEEFVTKIVDFTVGEVVEILDPLLFSPEAGEGFQLALRKLIADAVQLWRIVQRSEKKGEVSNDPEYLGSSGAQEQCWASNEVYDNEVVLTGDQTSHISDLDPVMPLFPRLSIGEKVIYRGCALWSDQNAVVAGSFEFVQMNSRNSAQSRGHARRDSDRRRLSFNASPTLGRRGDDSPRSPLSNQSFADRAHSRTNSRTISLPATLLAEAGGSGGGG